MVFSSLLFVFLFLPVVLVLYYISTRFHGTVFSNSVLVVASMVFYAWSGLKPFLILLLIILCNYLLTLKMASAARFKTFLFLILILLDLGNLLYFKYFNFFMDNFQSLVHLAGKKDWVYQGARVVLPIGISFYTFQIMSYVIDVYRKKVEPQKSLLNLTLYVMMFPQLIAGPIVRYSDINREIGTRRSTFEGVENGLKRFIIGFAKKVFIANAAGSMADVVFGFTRTGPVNTLYAWAGAICYSLQIYYDFSAYSDMAIGLGEIFGFHFNENFNYPYIAQSIQEFWRRWHISLSTWFRDYVYIPLGGSRKGTFKTYRNLFIVFLLTGFWHGAAWQFVVWGLFHGAFMLIERAGFGNILKKLPSIIRRFYTLLIVIVGWVFFRADNLAAAVNHLKCMFIPQVGFFNNVEIIKLVDKMFVLCFLCAVIFSTPLYRKISTFRIMKNRLFSCTLHLVLWVVTVLYLCGLSYNPFIYFQF